MRSTAGVTGPELALTVVVVTTVLALLVPIALASRRHANERSAVRTLEAEAEPTGVKDGYRFTTLPGGGATAVPESDSCPGARTFTANEARTIFFTSSTTPPSN